MQRYVLDNIVKTLQKFVAASLTIILLSFVLFDFDISTDNISFSPSLVTLVGQAAGEVAISNQKHKKDFRPVQAQQNGNIVINNINNINNINVIIIVEVNDKNPQEHV